MITALVVCDDIATLVERRRIIREAGFDTLTCRGPSVHECPRLWDQPCALREMTDLAVIETVGPAEDGYAQAEQICTAVRPDAGTVVITEDDTFDGPGIRLRPPVAPDHLVLSVGLAALGGSRPA